MKRRVTAIWSSGWGRFLVYVSRLSQDQVSFHYRMSGWVTNLGEELKGTQIRQEGDKKTLHILACYI
jgi:hypothetical protein